MTRRLAIKAAAGAAVLWASGAAFADPASSPQSAWSDVPLKSAAQFKDPLLARGKEVFDARCEACHGAAPKRDPKAPITVYSLPPRSGTAALEARYKGSKPALLEQRTDLTPETVAFFVRHGGGVMPPFRPTEVSGEDLKALGAYLARKR
jgi:mono/diheme cytochrome c family protein